MARVIREEINGDLGIYRIFGTADPSSAPGINAGIGSEYISTTDGTKYTKTGALATDWAVQSGSGGGGSVSWASVTGKPTTFAPVAHTHLIADLPAAVVVTTDPRLSDARAPTTHSHAQGDVTGLAASLAAKANTSHTHAEADVTGLTAALAGKAAAAHTHAFADLTNKPTTLAGYGITDASSGGGFTPAWIFTGAGALFGLFGDGNPRELADWMSTATSVAGPTPTQITTSIARAVMFRLPKAISVTTLRLFGVAATTNLYKFAIYNAGTGARVWESGAVSSSANAWQSVTAATPFSLAADTNYWWCVTAAAVGTTAGYRSPSPPLHANIFGANVSPLGGRAIGMETYAQFAVTAGAFPLTLPAIVAAAYSGGATGSVPFAWIEGTTS